MKFPLRSSKPSPRSSKTPVSPAIAVSLADGRVLTMNSVGQATELFSPTTSTWTLAASTYRITSPRATRLADGRLVFSGQLGTSGVPPSGTPVYNATANTFADTLPIARHRSLPALVTLPNGRVLTAGGNDPASSVLQYSDAEIYDPTYNQWSAIDPMGDAHADPAYGVFADGSAIVAAGTGAFGAPTSTSYRYVPLVDGAACAGPVALACAAKYCVAWRSRRIPETAACSRRRVTTSLVGSSRRSKTSRVISSTTHSVVASTEALRGTLATSAT